MSALFQLSMWIRVRATSSSKSEGRLSLFNIYMAAQLTHGDSRQLTELLSSSQICVFSPFQQCHTYFTENLGIPNWGSYAIFAFVTLFSGLLLGLVSKHVSLHSELKGDGKA